MTQSLTKKVWINGCQGRMGNELKQAILADSRFSLIGGSDNAYFGEFQGGILSQLSPEDGSALLRQSDIIIDFSSTEGTRSLFQLISSIGLKHKSVLIATTGISVLEQNDWNAVAKLHNLKIMFAPNTSLGVALVTNACLHIAAQLRQMGFDIEIIETHHKHKADSPSGTALFIAEQIASQENLNLVVSRSGKREPNELGVFAMRGGSVFGEHTIRFLGESEEISISHRAVSRSLFAKGSLALAVWLMNQPIGTWGLKDFTANL